MKILFINNNGAGFAEQIEIADGTTVSQLFAQQLPGRKATDYLIRVDRQPAASDQVLVEGQRLSITPVKLEGACREAMDPVLRI